MRLSDWRAHAPHRDAMAAKVLAVVEPVLATLGAAPDRAGAAKAAATEPAGGRAATASRKGPVLGSGG